MSREDVELLRSLYEEWARGNFRAHPEVYDPEIRYGRVMDEETEGVGLGGEWRGLDGFVAGIRLWVDAWQDLQVEAEEFIQAGEKVVVFTRQRGRARVSGAPLDRQMADVYEVRQGKIVAMHSYWNRTDALEAAGLSDPAGG
jgi:ketosteroid isomerase-like protein